MTFAPSYYKRFKCIADRCAHNCCIGWEIYIDEDTLEKYREVDTASEICVLRDVAFDEDGAHFVLGEGGRCPNLRPDNLCRLICELGEDSLCDICREHPRFRVYLGEREEIGIGLSCEEAARIILTYPEAALLEPMEGDGGSRPDGEALLIRERVISRLQDRSVGIRERIIGLADELDARLPYEELADWCGFYRSLERLDEAWTDVLDCIASCGVCTCADAPLEKNELAAEQLLVYFIRRHYCPDVGTDIRDAFRLALVSTAMIFSAAEGTSGGDHLHALCEAARMYSAEIEYSPENTEELLFELSI